MRKAVPATALVFVTLSMPVLAGRWAPPNIPDRPAQLPRLSQPLVLDGDVAEWSAATSVPLLSKSYLLYCRPPHKWNGPPDAGMVVHCAWNDDGLCLAAVVADDDVRNDMPANDYWKQDCVEFFIDGRVGEKLMTRPYSQGAYQVLVRPPMGDRPPDAVVNERDGKIAGLKVAGKRTAAGYSIELLVPWSAFPGFAPKSGAPLGVQFALDEYDKRDRALEQPVVISYRAADNLWQYPQNLIRWELADAAPAGAGSDLGPKIAIDVPPLYTAAKALPVKVELTGAAASLRVTASDGSGKQLFERTVKATALTDPWDDVKAARTEIPLTASMDGYYVIGVEAIDSNGASLGSIQRPCLCVGNTLRNAISLIGKTDLRRMSRSQPFRATQYLGVAARIEQLERWIERHNYPDVLRNARDLESRVDLLSDGRLDGADLGIYDLIGLAANPDAQVVVEYTGPAEAHVTLYWGAIPLASADVIDPAPAGAKSGGASIRRGTRLVRVNCPVRSVAEKVAQLVADGKPIAPEEVDAVRAQIVKALAPKDAAPLPEGLNLYCGDLHVHSFFSDGSSSPVGMVLQSMYCFMDYMALTDHNTIDGALLARKLLSDHGVGQPLVVGEEITMDWAHMNAYPVEKVISEKLSPFSVVRAAHAQGAAIQWNHPTGVDSEWMRYQLPRGLLGTGLDAWEHMPPDYDAWKAAGKLPTITGTTDTHNGTFSYPERTVILAPGTTGEDVANAVRTGNASAVFWTRGHYLYGSEKMTSLVWSALAEGKALKTAKAQAIRRALAESDIAGLIDASLPRK